MGIQILGQRQLIARIKNGFPVRKNLISIGNPDKGEGKEDQVVPEIFVHTFESILRLSFNDIWEDFPDFTLPKKSDVGRAIAFYKEHLRDVTIHCWGGTSRSTAIGLGLLYVEYGDEKKAMDELFRIRPYALPNKLIVSYYDEILGSNLTEALKTAPNNKRQSILRGIKRQKDAKVDDMTMVGFAGHLVQKGIIKPEPNLIDGGIYGVGLGQIKRIDVSRMEDSKNIILFVEFADGSSEELLDVSKSSAYDFMASRK